VSLGIVSDILGKESAAGKAAALAKLLIIYQGITAGIVQQLYQQYSSNCSWFWCS
jgi:hypothetical protein